MNIKKISLALSLAASTALTSHATASMSFEKEGMPFTFMNSNSLFDNTNEYFIEVKSTSGATVDVSIVNFNNSERLLMDRSFTQDSNFVETLDQKYLNNSPLRELIHNISVDNHGNINLKGTAKETALSLCIKTFGAVTLDNFYINRLNLVATSVNFQGNNAIHSTTNFKVDSFIQDGESIVSLGTGKYSVMNARIEKNAQFIGLDGMCLNFLDLNNLGTITSAAKNATVDLQKSATLGCFAADKLTLNVVKTVDINYLQEKCDLICESLSVNYGKDIYSQFNYRKKKVLSVKEYVANSSEPLINYHPEKIMDEVYYKEWMDKVETQIKTTKEFNAESQKKLHISVHEKISEKNKQQLNDKKNHIVSESVKKDFSKSFQALENIVLPDYKPQVSIYCVNINNSNNEKVQGRQISGLINHTALDLTENNKIPDSNISDLKNLTWLNLTRNKKIDGYDIRGMQNLTALDLTENNKIDGYDIRGLENLTALNLTENNKIDGYDIRYLKNLTWLNLTRNKKIDGYDIRYLKNLTALDLTENNKIDGSDICYLKKLTWLNLTRNKKIDDNTIVSLIKQNPNIVIIQ